MNKLKRRNRKGDDNMLEIVTHFHIQSSGLMPPHHSAISAPLMGTLQKTLAHRHKVQPAFLVFPATTALRLGHRPRRRKHQVEMMSLNIAFSSHWRFVLTSHVSRSNIINCAYVLIIIAQVCKYKDNLTALLISKLTSLVTEILFHSI